MTVHVLSVRCQELLGGQAMTRLCLRCKSLAMGKTSPEALALAEEALGPHICESNRSKITMWIAKDALGEVRGGCESGDGCSAVSLLTPVGWKRLGGYLNIHVSQDQYSEAIGELCVRAHDSRLMHCSVDDRSPWPDADGPWRLEVPLAVLESTP